MSAAQNYHKLADRCVTWAKEAQNDRSREAFKNLAQYWEKEARRAEGFEAGSANAEADSAVQAELASD